MELQESVQEHGGEGERREGVARARHQSSRPEKQLARRLAAAGDRSVHKWGDPVQHAGRDQDGKVVDSTPMEELDLAAAREMDVGFGRRWAHTCAVSSSNGQETYEARVFLVTGRKRTKRGGGDMRCSYLDGLVLGGVWFTSEMW